jgi:hypothetical protein
VVFLERTIVKTMPVRKNSQNTHARTFAAVRFLSLGKADTKNTVRDEIRKQIASEIKSFDL